MVGTVIGTIPGIIASGRLWCRDKGYIVNHGSAGDPGRTWRHVGECQTNILILGTWGGGARKPDGPISSKGEV